MIEFSHSDPITFQDHVWEGEDFVGTVTEDGEPIVGPMTQIPLSGTIRLSDMGRHILNQDRMWMDNGYMKDLIQNPSSNRKLTDYYGAAWGSPLTTIDQGAGGMAVYKWDWRFDGDGRVDVTQKETSGTWGSTKHLSAVYNNSSCTGPSAITGNGYSYAETGLYTLTFNWGDYQQFVPNLSVNTESDCYVAVWAYTDGYLNGVRNELVRYQKVKNASGTSGSRSINFTVYRGQPHIVVNFSWWCDKWGGSHGYKEKEGIRCSISNAKVWRYS